MEAGQFLLYGKGVFEESDDAIGYCIVVNTELQPIGLAEGEGKNIIMIRDAFPFFGHGRNDLFCHLTGSMGADGVVVGEGGDAEGNKIDGRGVQDEAGTFIDAIFDLVVLPDLESEMAGGGGDL